MNILITSLSRKVPLLDAFRAALDGQGVLWGADADPGCVGRYFADSFWEMPRLSRPDAAQEVLRFCADEEIGLLIPTRDGELTFFAELRETLAAAGTTVPIGTPSAVTTCLDKLAFHSHCRKSGLPAAPTARTLDDLAGDRFVVKERWGAGARSVAVDLDRRAAAAYAERLEAPIFQSLVSGLEHSVDVYVSREGRVVEAAPRSRLSVHEGESNVTETVEHPGLLTAAVRLATSLPLRGHLVIQAFTQGNDVTLIECNPRVGGASTLGFHAGVATPRWSLAEAAGEMVTPRLGEYRRGVRLVRYPADRLIEP